MWPPLLLGREALVLCRVATAARSAATVFFLLMRGGGGRVAVVLQLLLLLLLLVRKVRVGTERALARRVLGAATCKPRVHVLVERLHTCTM